MKWKKLGTLVTVAAMLAVMTSGNALAYSWSTTSDGSNDGIEYSYISSSGTPILSHWITQNINTAPGATLTWGNKWHNGYTSAVYYGWSYQTGVNGGNTYSSIYQIQVGGDDTTRDASLTNIQMPFHEYKDQVNEQHRYAVTSWQGTDLHYAQEYTWP